MKTVNNERGFCWELKEWDTIKPTIFLLHVLETKLETFLNWNYVKCWSPEWDSTLQWWSANGWVWFTALCCTDQLITEVRAIDTKQILTLDLVFWVCKWMFCIWKLRMLAPLKINWNHHNKAKLRPGIISKHLWQFNWQERNY